MSEFQKGYAGPAVLQQAQGAQSTDLDQTIFNLHNTLCDISIALQPIVNRVLIPEPQPPENKPAIASVSVTYQQKIDEVQAIAARVLDTVRKLNGRI